MPFPIFSLLYLELVYFPIALVDHNSWDLCSQRRLSKLQPISHFGTNGKIVCFGQVLNYQNADIITLMQNI